MSSWKSWVQRSINDIKSNYKDCRRRRKNLNTAWTDYQKASDSVPFSWVEKLIELVRVNSKTVKFLKSSLEEA
jgi:hypothetical protein